MLQVLEVGDERVPQRLDLDRPAPLRGVTGVSPMRASIVAFMDA